MFENLKLLEKNWIFSKADINWEEIFIEFPIKFIKNWLADNSDNYRDLEEMLKNEEFKPEFVEWIKNELELYE